MTDSFITKQDVQQWVNYYKKRFNLQEWKIQIKLVDQVTGVPLASAGIKGMDRYKSAELEICIHRCKKNQLKALLKHEMLHLFHIEYDELLEEVLKHLEPNFPELADAYFNLSRHTVERLVTKIERIIK